MNAMLCLFLAALTTVAQAAPKEAVPMENSLGMEFVRVSGSNVQFSIWETRVRDYQIFKEEAHRAWKSPEFEQTPEDPVVNVTWEDAAAFCQWLTERERKSGRLTAQQRYRLPTDQEWSVAVGLGPEQGRTPEDRSATRWSLFLRISSERSTF